MWYVRILVIILWLLILFKRVVVHRELADEFRHGFTCATLLRYPRAVGARRQRERVSQDKSGPCDRRVHYFTATLALRTYPEKDVVNDVWRVVNAAYVDPTFNGLDWKAVRLKVRQERN